MIRVVADQTAVAHPTERCAGDAAFGGDARVNIDQTPPKREAHP